MPLGPAFALCLTLSAAVFSASAAPSPFYELQERQWGVPAFFITLAVAVYAVAFLLALLTMGSLADHVGYRPVIAVSMAIQAASMLAFMVAPSIEWVIVARATQGFAMGASVGALGACVTLFTPGRATTTGTTLAVVSPQLGSALGSLTAGWAIQYLSQPAVVVYGCYAALFGVGAVAVAFLPGNRPNRIWQWSLHVPSVAVPPSAHAAFWRTAPVIFAGWMLGGLYLGLVPILVRDLLGAVNPLAGGVTVAAFSAISGFAGLAARHLAPRVAVIAGPSAMTAGALTVGVATLTGSFPLFLLATLFGAIGYGVSSVGAIRTIMAFVDPVDRSSVFSSTYVIGYIAFGAPIALAGLLAGVVSLASVTVWYSLVAAALAVFGLVMVQRLGRAVPERRPSHRRDH